MNDDRPFEIYRPGNFSRTEPEYIIPVVVEESYTLFRQEIPSGSPAGRWRLSAALFTATCLSTCLVGGWQYSAAVMFILLCHELGHYIQARRHGVLVSLPYFLPMPFSPLGTLGAVIAMGGRMKDRRALFDIGITGPLAGLAPTLVCVVVGLQWSQVDVSQAGGLQFGEPLLFQFIGWLTFGPIPPGHSIYIHPLAIAGWVGVLITALNLLPIGQLDGGHVLYAIAGRRANRVGRLLLLAAWGAVIVLGYWVWTLMLVLLVVMGPRHPPTLCDDLPLGWGRTILGWLTLAFVLIGFTPQPFVF